jgi:DnaJ-class molecular chaperone
MEMEIELVEALCGFQRIITRLDGHQLLLTVPPGQVCGLWLGTARYPSPQCLVADGVVRR